MLGSAHGGAGIRVWLTDVVLVVGAMVVAPIGFLAGIGCFDYWGRYIIGRRRCPRITPTTAPTPGTTTSRSTPITR